MGLSKKEINEIRAKRRQQNYMLPEVFRMLSELACKDVARFNFQYDSKSSMIALKIYENQNTLHCVNIETNNPRECMKICRFMSFIDQFGYGVACFNFLRGEFGNVRTIKVFE